MTLTGSAWRSTSGAFRVRRGRTGDRSASVLEQGWIAMAWSDGDSGLAGAPNVYNAMLAQYESLRVAFRSESGGPPERGHIFYRPTEPLSPPGAGFPSGFVSSRLTGPPSLAAVIDAFNARRGNAKPRFVFLIRETVELGGEAFDDFGAYIVETFPGTRTRVATGFFYLQGVIATLGL